MLAFMLPLLFLVALLVYFLLAIWFATWLVVDEGAGWIKAFQFILAWAIAFCLCGALGDLFRWEASGWPYYAVVATGVVTLKIYRFFVPVTEREAFQFDLWSNLRGYQHEGGSWPQIREEFCGASPETKEDEFEIDQAEFDEIMREPDDDGPELFDDDDTTEQIAEKIERYQKELVTKRSNYTVIVASTFTLRAGE